LAPTTTIKMSKISPRPMLPHLLCYKSTLKNKFSVRNHNKIYF